MVHRAQLRAAGIGPDAVRNEIAARRWRAVGRSTLAIGPAALGEEALLWRAVWESGSGALLDGAAALIAAGMNGFRLDSIDVSIPAGSRPRIVPGVRVQRRRALAPVAGGGIPRVRPDWATIHAAQTARTDRAAALLVCLPIQQRIVVPERLLATWQTVRYSARRALLELVIRDVCDGAHSLGELDFARLCRQRGLPAPSRQVVRSGPGGRIYLDVEWSALGLVVEIDGGHHARALHPVDDALRQNEITLGRRIVLRIPVLGLRLTPDRFMDQVVRAHRIAADRLCAADVAL